MNLVPRFLNYFACMLVTLAGSIWTSVPGRFASPGPFAQQTAKLTVKCYSDNLDNVATRVQVKSSRGQKQNVWTDAEGWTPLFQVDVNEDYMVYQKQVSLPMGFILGQARPWAALDLGTPNAFVSYSLALTQPVLEAVLLEPLSSKPMAPTQHSRWEIYADDPLADFLVPAEVGMLVNDGAIDAYASYYGLSFPTDYSLGVVIKTSDVLSLGRTGLSLDIDCAGYGLPSSPAVDVWFISSDSNKLNGSSSINPMTTYWGPDVAGGGDEMLTLHLSGDLGDGYNLIMIRPDDGFQFGGELLSFPYSFGGNLGAAAPGGPGSPGTLGGGGANGGSGAMAPITKCDPQPSDPSPDQPCFPDKPNGYSKCDPVSEAGPPIIQNMARPSGDRQCVLNAAGGALSLSDRSEWNANITVKARVKGVPVQLNGGYTGTSTSSLTGNFGPGMGCGQCARPFRTHSVVSQKWEVDKPWGRGTKLCRLTHKTTKCVEESGPDIEFCDATGCN